MKTILFLMIVAACSSCTVRPDDMVRLMKQEGITDYTFTGYDAWACSKDDTISTGFKGKKNGSLVRGTVCGAWLKGYTIRYK